MCLPRDHAVDTDLRRRFDGLLIASTFRQGLHEDQVRIGGRFTHDVLHHQIQFLTVHGSHAALCSPPFPIHKIKLISNLHAAHRGSMFAFGSAQVDVVPLGNGG